MPQIPVHAVDDADLWDLASRLAVERLHDNSKAETEDIGILRLQYHALGRCADRLQMRCSQNELLLHEKNVEIEKLKAKLAKAKGKSDEET